MRGCQGDSESGLVFRVSDKLEDMDVNFGIPARCSIQFLIVLYDGAPRLTVRG